MLQAMRRHAGSWVAKIFLLLLAASFGLWGVGDIFSGYRDPVVAEVGGRDIHASAFFQEYNQRVAELRRSLGGAVDENLLREIGLPEEVLNDMARRLLIREEAGERGLVAGQEDLGRWLREQPAFRNSLGQFDRNLFAYTARAQGLRQDEFLARLGELRTGELLLDAVSFGAHPPDRWLRTFYALEQERRRARAAVFLAATADPPEPAADEEVRLRHEEAGERYQTLQRRDLTFVVLDPAVLKSTIEITEAELAEAHEQRRDEFFEAERRHVRQYFADTREAAERVLTRAREGGGLAAAVEEEIGDEVIDLGFVTRAELDGEYAETVFRTGTGAAGGPVDTGFGWRVFEVVEIQAAQTPVLADVRDALTDALQTERALDLLYARAETFYDERAGNATLEEAAQASGASILTVTDLDAQGLDRSGAPHPAAPDTVLLGLGFGASPAAASDLEELEDGRMVAVRVDRDVPARPMTLEEAREAILEDLAEEARLADALQRAEAYAAGTAGTANLTALATVHDGELRTSDAFTRDGQGAAADFPSIAWQLAFELEPATTSDPEPFGGGYVVVTLDEVISAGNPDDEELAPRRIRSGATLGNDFVTSFLSALQQAHPVRIHRSALERVLSDSAGASY